MRVHGFWHRCRMASALVPFALLLSCLIPSPARGETISVQGQRLVDVLDSLRVEQHWLPGEPVDWRTGEVDPASKALSGHCSAFVAAVCATRDIYILRPPAHDESLLANAQCEWLQAEGPREGWTRVDDGATAQRLANYGHVVVACYRNPDADDAGHIAIVRPSTKSGRRIEAEGPDLTQAGAHNYRRTSAKSGFRLHPEAWTGSEILYYSHVADWDRGREAGPHAPAGTRDRDLPGYLRDRGTGISTSLFGTYVRRGELLFYPFFEYSRDDNREYQPAQLGYGLDEDFRGKYRDSRGQIFIAYGVTDRVALEFEAASIRASLERSPSDAAGTPAKINESGLGDVEGQLRVRLMNESDHHPEVFSYLEITAPSLKGDVLIGDPEWDFKPGVGVARGYAWGTMTLRATLEYNREASHPDVGEVAVEYLRRLSPAWRVYLGVEGGETGAPDEWDFNSGVCWRVARFASIKLDNALGISSKATDWAPQMGIMLAFPS
jgi:hypothetical protein